MSQTVRGFANLYTTSNRTNLRKHKHRAKRGGTVSPGFSVGHLDVQGNYTQQSASTLLVDVTGANGSQHDTVSVAGSTQLGGTISVNAAGFVPGTVNNGTYGAPIPILTAGSRSGKFTSIQTTGSSTIVFIPIYSAPGSGLASGEISRVFHARIIWPHKNSFVV